MLFSQSGLREFLKLPALVVHYIEHIEDHSDLSFIHFIHEHYDQHSSCSKGDESHTDLPFKDPQCCVSMVVCAVLPSITEFSFSQFAIVEPARSSYLLQVVTGALDAIWQPPG